MLRFAVFVLFATTVAAPVPSGAQVNKPTRTLSDRLPQPATATASQQPDGRILVVWSAVDGAHSYKLVRSVPPDGAKPVPLTNPSDTQYVDTDVQAGRTYYYVVSAINEAGMEGLKKGVTSVKAGTASTTMRNAGDPEMETTTGTTGGTAPAMPPQPVNVVAKPYPYLRPTVTWESAKPGLRFLLERKAVSSASKDAWEQVQGPYLGGLLPCCQREDFQAPAGEKLVYRVTAVDTLPPGYRSTPALSNEVVNSRIMVNPPVLDAVQIELGGYRYLAGTRPFQDAGLRLTKWVSLHPAIVSTEREGWIKGEYVSTTHVVVTGIAPNGALQSVIWRVEVVPNP